MPWVTWLLIAINVLVWLTVNALDDQGQLAAVAAIAHIGGPLPEWTSQVTGPLAEISLPGPVSALTSSFLHLDFWHLAGNLAFLWVFGDNVEDALGHARFFVFYALCAIAASYAEAFFSPGFFILGASGALSGVVAAFVMLHPRVRLWALVLMKFPIAVPAVWLIAAWAVFQLFNVAVQDTDAGVAWWAHIGGAIAGAALLPLLKHSDVPLFDRGVRLKPDEG